VLLKPGAHFYQVMSLMSADQSSQEQLPSVNLKLRTPDQYHLWLARITDLCWAHTKIDITTVKDVDCEIKSAASSSSTTAAASSGSSRGASRSSRTGDTEDDEKTLAPWVQKCWLLITTSLHDDVYLKVQHIKRGQISSLLSEIFKCVMLGAQEEVVPTRIGLYGATMAREGGGDLQTFIAYIKTKQNKLQALGDPLKETELVGIFLNGLTSIFHPVVVVLRGVADALPKTLDDAIDKARKFAAQPAVAAELLRAKTSTSQHLFPVIPARVQPSSTTTSKSTCKSFALGKCKFGERCKFKHIGVPMKYSRGPSRDRQEAIRTCNFCGKTGHSARRCINKFLSETPKQTPPKQNNFTTALLATCEGPKEPILSKEEALETKELEFSFVLSEDKKRSFRDLHWVIDSGATCSATFSMEDCVDVQPCSILINGAGGSFTVHRKGTAKFSIVNQKGEPCSVSIENTLISDKFPYRLWALQSITNKGGSASISGDTMLLYLPGMETPFVAEKNCEVKLFFIKKNCCQSSDMSRSQLPSDAKTVNFHFCNNFFQPPILPIDHETIQQTKTTSSKDGVDHDSILLAKSYSAFDSKPQDLLWKLHLRHGHRNFVDVARQYNLPLPKAIPACSSCLMGKGHKLPHLGGSFERAKRIGQGFHADFKGPYSVPTPEGFLYLLILVDDYSKRIFAYLVKSQDEWLEVWKSFVARIEAELGSSTAVSWLVWARCFAPTQ
jgi:hypothetical protein